MNLSSRFLVMLNVLFFFAIIGVVIFFQARSYEDHVNVAIQSVQE